MGNNSEKKKGLRGWKLVLLIIACIGVGSAFAGGSDDSDAKTKKVEKEDTGTKSASEDESKESDEGGTDWDKIDTYALGDTIDVKGVQYIFSDAYTIADDTGMLVDEGNEYLVVKVTIKNTTKDVKSYNIFDYKIEKSDGQVDDTSVISTVDNKLSSGDLTPNGTVTGNIVFEIPSGSTGNNLLYYNTMFNDYPEFKVTLN